jgi:hypothetical protein
VKPFYLSNATLRRYGAVETLVGQDFYERAIAAEDVDVLVVGLYTLNSVDPKLGSAWFQPLSLKCDILVSSLCFQMQLVPLHRVLCLSQ